MKIRSLFTLALCLCFGLSYGQELKVTATGVGINTQTPTVPLDVPVNSLQDNVAEFGSFGIASLSANNGFLTSNCYFSLDASPTGAEVVMRTTGKGAIAQFFDGRIIYRTVPQAAAGATSPVVDAFTVQNDGGFQIGYAWPDDRPEKLEVNGNIAANGVVLTSDARVKKNIQEFTRGLSAVMRLNPVTYEYNGKAGIEANGQEYVGLVAQDLQKVAPELVLENNYIAADLKNNMKGEARMGAKEDYLRINDTGVKYMLINAIKEQQQQIQELKKEIDALKNK